MAQISSYKGFMLIVLACVMFSCKSKQAAIESVDPNFVYEIPDVDSQPTLNGVDFYSSFQEYLKEHLIYPKEAVEQKITGRVTVQFIIEKDGSITNQKVIRGVNGLLDASALRLINEMPVLTAGVKDGQNVRVRITIPISFKLQQPPSE